ncbi:MAG TPA: hypothetical protein VFB82_12985 [Blastocatellia bacterium]|jgi:hypothetical protein|nr:hypothetical protein [Blastocatellia bacterium]
MLGDISACLAKLVSLVQESRGDGRDAYRDGSETSDTNNGTEDRKCLAVRGRFESFEGLAQRVVL